MGQPGQSSSGVPCVNKLEAKQRAVLQHFPEQLINEGISYLDNHWSKQPGCAGVKRDGISFQGDHREMTRRAGLMGPMAPSVLCLAQLSSPQGKEYMCPACSKAGQA